MSRALIVIGSAAAILVVGYLALWGYANQDHSIRCREHGGTAARIGLTDYSAVWSYFASSTTHCIPTVRKK